MVKVQGITISLGADASGIESALTDVDKASKKTSKELSQINRALKFDPGNVALLQQRFDVLQDAVQNTTNKLDGLRQAQAEVNRQFEAGEIDDSTFRAFNREVEATEGLLRNLQNQAQQTDLRINAQVDSSGINQMEADLEGLADTAEDTGSRITQALAGAAAGIGIAGIVESGLAESDLQAKIDIGFDVPEESKESVREALADVKAYGIDGEEALEGLRKQWALNKDASDATNKSVVESAAAISGAYSDIDFKELIQESYEIGQALNISDQEALKLVNSLLDVGFPPDQLDIIAEYGSQLQRAGFEAEQVKGILASAASVGSFDIDNLLDGLKEGRIRAVEMGAGLSETMKEGLREVVGTVEGMTDEQLQKLEAKQAAQEEIMSKSHDKQLEDATKAYQNQEEALSKSLDERLDLVEGEYDAQEEAMDKSFDAQYDAAGKSFDKQRDALADSLDDRYEAVVDTYDKQEDALEDSLDAELKALEEASDKKIKMIDKEYMARMKLIDEDRYNKLKAIDDEINGLKALTEAEDKAARDKANADKRAELNADISNARTKKGRRLATEKLAEFEAKLRVDQLQEEREAEIDNLKIKKDGVNESADAREEALKTEFDLKKEQANEEIELNKETLKKKQELELEAFQKRRDVSLEAIKEANGLELTALSERKTAYLKNMKEINKEEKKAFDERKEIHLDSIKEMNDKELEALGEKNADKLSKVQEDNQKELSAFEKMNAKKLELAETPPDTAAFKAMESQLVTWGKAIASGTDPKAFEDMVNWLNSIEDATLRNTIGTEIFGGVWEDQGENLVKTLMGAEEALAGLTEKERNELKIKEEMNESALKKMTEAKEKMLVALAPVFTAIANIVGAISEFIIANPILSGTIATVAVIIGILAAAFFALAPAIAAIPMIIPLITGAFAALSGVFATVTAALPVVGAAIAAIGAPVAIAIAAIAAIIAIFVLVVENWDWIREQAAAFGAFIADLFTALWGTVVDIFTGLWKGVTGALTNLWKDVTGIWDWITDGAAEFAALMGGIFSTMGDTITGVFTGLWKNITGIWDNITQGIRWAINEIIELINGFIGGMNQLKIPDWVPAVGGQGVNIPTIPMLAKGTDYFQGGMAIVGEQGPELVQMPKGSKVTPNDKTMGMMGGNVTVQNMVVREDADIRRIARELHQLQQVDRRGR